MSYIAIISDYTGYPRDSHTAIFPNLYPREVAEFETEADALAAYPSALILEKSAYVTYLEVLQDQFLATDTTYKVVMKTIKQRREYAEDLMERGKRKNILNGVSAVQAMWVHQRMRALPVSYGGQNFTIDFLNLAISGDIEVACLCLMNTPPDDMTETYHFISQAFLDWLIADMKAYLGWP